MLVGRAALFMVGLAVVLFLTLAVVAGSAEARVPAIKKGVVNTVSSMTTLVGSLTDPILKLDNNGSGPALQLDAEAGNAPLVVNADAGTATNLDADELDGKTSAQFAQLSGFKATEVIDINGPLPREGTFTSNGGMLLISVAGSGFRGSGNTTRDSGLIGMRVYVDGQWLEHVYTYTNEVDSHKAFVSNNFVLNDLGAGTHTIRLERTYDAQICNTANESDGDACTTTDRFDSFNVSVLEIPR
jgi:hypothetical protein